jgi:hypothetical protein
MALDLLLRKAILGRLVPDVAPELYSGHKAYRKVLKHKQIELLQFRTVFRSTARGSLGKEMGKLLGKPVQTSDNLEKRSPAILTHLMYMSVNLWCGGKPCRSPRRDGGCL